jgi:hypothetical protein
MMWMNGWVSPFGSSKAVETGSKTGPSSVDVDEGTGGFDQCVPQMDAHEEKRRHPAGDGEGQSGIRLVHIVH